MINKISASIAVLLVIFAFIWGVVVSWFDESLKANFVNPLRPIALIYLWGRIDLTQGGSNVERCELISSAIGRSGFGKRSVGLYPH